MEKVKSTAEYTLYKRRDGRYAIKNADKQWVRGDDKVAILKKENLIKAPAPKPAEPEPEETAEAAGEENAEESSSEEAEEK